MQQEFHRHRGHFSRVSYFFQFVHEQERERGGGGGGQKKTPLLLPFFGGAQCAEMSEGLSWKRQRGVRVRHGGFLTVDFLNCGATTEAERKEN